MDYVNSKIAPDLIRFMKTNIKGKNKSYYMFLKKIGEETLSYFKDEEIDLIDNVSELLPIVRCDEMLILKRILNNEEINLDAIVGYNTKVTKETLKHALNLLIKEKIITNEYKLNVNEVSDELKNYLNDLIEFSLELYDKNFGEFDGTFKLMGNYYKEQVMRVLLENSLMFMKGTKFNENGVTFVFIGLKKDSSKEERLNYKDKFISSKVFQWESENKTTIGNSTGKKLLNTKVVHLFIRKMDSQDSVILPFTYFGTGKFTNMRETKNNEFDTLTFDIILDYEVEEEYFLDFEVPSEETNNE